MAIKGLLFGCLQKRALGFAVQCSENIKIRIEAQVINTTCGFPDADGSFAEDTKPPERDIFLVAGIPIIR
jgi:hypothetical protein